METLKNREVMTKTTKKRIVSFSLIILGILVLIAGVVMVQTGFTTFDDDKPRVVLYIGGIFTIIGGVFSTVGGIIFLNFNSLKRSVFRTLGKIADAVEEERIQEKN